MAVRISSSKFLESTVVKKVIVDHLNDPIRTGGGPLPDTIKNGVAKLIEVYFDKDEQDRESFHAIGEVVYPDFHGGQYIKGRRTKQWVPYSIDTMETDIPRIQSVLVGLGGKAILGDGKNVNFFKIAEFLNAATANKPIYFAFSTSPKKPQGPPKIDKETGEPATVWPWENWYAAIPGFNEKATTGSVPVETQKKTESAVVTPLHHDTAPWSESKPVEETKPAESNEYSLNTYDDSSDIDSLISRATAKDTSAQDKLGEFAKALGYNDEDLDESESWEQVGGWIKSGVNKGGNSPTDVTPVKAKRVITEGQVYTYEPVNKKDDTKRLKSRECRVLKIDNIREVATIQNLAKKDEVYEVAFDDEFLK